MYLIDTRLAQVSPLVTRSPVWGAVNVDLALALGVATEHAGGEEG